MYSRESLPTAFESQEALTSALVAIGMRFAAVPSKSFQSIEDCLFVASFEGVEGHDYRLLSVLTTWLSVHHEVVIADRLTRLVKALPVGPLRAYWVSVGQWLNNDGARFSRLAGLWPSDEPRIHLEPSSGFLLERHGEDPRLAGGPLIVHARLLRDRAADVSPPEEVSRSNVAYRYRVMMGPRYSSDMWAFLEMHQTPSCADLARRTYGSYATAHAVLRRFAIVQGANVVTA